MYATNKWLGNYNYILPTIRNGFNLRDVIRISESNARKIENITLAEQNNRPARVISNKLHQRCIESTFQWGKIDKKNIQSLMQELDVDKWANIVVKRYPISIVDSEIKLQGETYNDFNKCKSLLSLSLLGISFLNPKVLRHGKSQFELTMVYYPENRMNKSFTETPHNDTYYRSCLFDITNAKSSTTLYVSINGKYLVEFMKRESGQGLVFPQKVKYSIDELGINLSNIENIYVNKNSVVKYVNRSKNNKKFQECVSEIQKYRHIKFPILHQASGERPRLVANLCEDLKRD